mgnify:CR=1 FL=1
MFEWVLGEFFVAHLTLRCLDVQSEAGFLRVLCVGYLEMIPTLSRSRSRGES